MFAELHRRAFALRHYIRFERSHLRIIRGDLLAASRLFDAPVDLFAPLRQAAQLYLKLTPAAFAGSTLSIIFPIESGRKRLKSKSGNYATK